MANSYKDLTIEVTECKTNLRRDFIKKIEVGKVLLAGLFSVLLVTSFGLLNGSASAQLGSGIGIGGTTLPTATTPPPAPSGAVTSTVTSAASTLTTTLDQAITNALQQISTAQQNLASSEQEISTAQKTLSGTGITAVASAQQQISSAQQSIATAKQQLSASEQALSGIANSTATTLEVQVSNSQLILASADKQLASAQTILSGTANPTSINPARSAQHSLLIAQTQISNAQGTLSSAATTAQQEISLSSIISSLTPASTSTANNSPTNTPATPSSILGIAYPPPTGLVAVAVSSSQINLSWNPPALSVLVAGYMIERSSDSGITWSTIVSNTGSTATTYSDTGLAPSTTYTYRVSAVYLAGTSQPSNTASATTHSAIFNLFVSSELANGSSVTGLYAYLTQNGQVVQSGFTPVTFFLNNTLTYAVGIDNYPPDVFEHWNDTGSTANPRAISISSNTAIAGVFQATNLSLSPTKGPVGTTVSATGTSFSANSTITMTWDGTALVTNPAVIKANSAGGFSASFQVPSTATSGQHTVNATDGSNSYSTAFTVSAGPAISLSASNVNVGTDVKVTGTGFAPNYQITLSFDGVPIGIGAQDVNSGSTSPSVITTDSSGNFVAIMQVLTTVAGSHTVSAEDSASDKASQPVTVSPHAYIFPTTAKPGQSVLIPISQGNGFAANSTITIMFDGTAVSSGITADPSGSFGGSFTVPSTATSGSHTIAISDSNGDKYTVPSFTVDPNAHSFSAQVVATGLAPPCTSWSGCTDVPAYFAFIPDANLTKPSSGSFMVNEKNSGNVIVFKNSGGQFVEQSAPFVKVPNLQVNYETNGLMGIAIDPNWSNTLSPEKWVYLYVTRNQTVNGVVTDNIIGQVIRYHATTDASGNIIADTSVGEQVVLGNIPNFVNGHNGGGLKFDPQGNLVISVGDGWQFDATAQNLASYQGKILRITPVYGTQASGNWYTIPSSNPFASSTNPVTQAIWAYGVRNPYGFDVDSTTGKIYIADTGFNTWEAILNATAPKSNGGWSDYERPPVGNPVNLQNYVPAPYWYGHQGVEPQTGPAAGLEALSAGAFYHGTTYPGLDGAYFFGDYGVGKIEAMLPISVAAPTTDPVSGVQENQVVPILYGLNLAPIYMEEWNGQIYFFDLYGNMYVLNYN